jgi:hypothetical protein
MWHRMLSRVACILAISSWQDSTSDHKADEIGSTEDLEEKKETVSHIVYI